MTKRVLNPTTDADIYKRFVTIACALTTYSPHKAIYVVEDTYLDYGQDWKWTTIIRYGHNECQILCPRDWEKIIEADTMEKLYEIINDLMNDEYELDYGKRG
jgi:hypothetical protein